MSRHAATLVWGGRKVVDDLRAQGIIVKSPSLRGVAEEAPGAYKDVGAVADGHVADDAGLAPDRDAHPERRVREAHRLGVRMTLDKNGIISGRRFEAPIHPAAARI